MMSGKDLAERAGKLHEATRLLAIMEDRRERLVRMRDGAAKGRVLVELTNERYDTVGHEFTSGDMEFLSFVALAIVANEREAKECRELIEKLGSEIHTGDVAHEPAK